MQKKVNQPVKLALIVLPIVLLGCASEPTPTPAPEQIISDQTLLRESQGIANLGERWKSGKQLVDRGTNMVSEGQAKITEGNRLIDAGNKIIRESEESYKSIKK